jgi:hypothetical protein
MSFEAMDPLPPRRALDGTRPDRHDMREQFGDLRLPPRSLLLCGLVVLSPLLLAPLLIVLLVAGLQGLVLAFHTALRHPCCWRWRCCLCARQRHWYTLNAAADVGAANAVRLLMQERCVDVREASEARWSLLLQRPVPDPTEWRTFERWQAARAGVVLAALSHPDLGPPAATTLLRLSAVADVTDTRVWARMVELGASTTAAQLPPVRGWRGCGGGGGVGGVLTGAGGVRAGTVVGV